MLVTPSTALVRRSPTATGGIQKGDGPPVPYAPTGRTAQPRPAPRVGVIVPGVYTPGQPSQPGGISDAQITKDWLARGGKLQQLRDNPKLMEGLRREAVRAHAPITSNITRSNAMAAAITAAQRVRAGGRY